MSESVERRFAIVSVILAEVLATIGLLITIAVESNSASFAICVVFMFATPLVAAILTLIFAKFLDERADAAIAAYRAMGSKSSPPAPDQP